MIDIGKLKIYFDYLVNLNTRNYTSSNESSNSLLSQYEVTLLEKYNQLLEIYFSEVIPLVYTSSVQETSAYYIDDNGNVIVENSRNIVTEFFSYVRSLLASLYTYVEVNQNIHKSIHFNNVTLFLILKSFGVYDKFLNLPIPVLKQLLYNIVRMYKYKGSYESIKTLTEKVLGKKYKICEVYSYISPSRTGLGSSLQFDLRELENNKIVFVKTENEVDRKHYYLTPPLYMRVSR